MRKRTKNNWPFPEPSKKVDPFRKGKTLFNFNVVEAIRKRKKPMTIFWCSTGDLFHDNNYDYDIEQVFSCIKFSSHLIHVILTKHPERMAAFVKGDQSILTSNVWLGVTVKDQCTADKQILTLLSIEGNHKTFINVESIHDTINLCLLDTGMTWPFKGETSKYDALKGYTTSRHAPSNIIGAFNDTTSRTFDLHHVKALDYVKIDAKIDQYTQSHNYEWIENLQAQCIYANVPCHKFVSTFIGKNKQRKRK